MSLSDRLNRPDRAFSEPNQPDAANYPHTGSLRVIASEIPSKVDHLAIRGEVNEALKELVGKQLQPGGASGEGMESVVFQAISMVIQRGSYPLTDNERAALVQEILDDILGNGPLEQLLRDSEVTEVMVVRFDQIYMERNGRLSKTNLTFNDEEHLRATIDRIVGRVGRRIDESSPLVDARLPDGSRVNAVVPPIAIDGANLTIRKFFKEPFTVKDMLATGTLTDAALAFLRAAVQGRLNVVISGGTGSGKTTTLNVASGFIPDDERIVTIEDSAELQLTKPHVIRLESRPANIEGQGTVTIRDLVRNALRMRPDRIVVGEVRDGAALDMLQAMNTGHDGSLTTVHANSTTDALSRLETMSLMAGMELPMAAIRDQVARAVDLVVQQSRLPDGSRRITAISEVVGVEHGVIKLQDVFIFRHGSLHATGHVPAVRAVLQDRGVNLDAAVFKR